MDKTLLLLIIIALVIVAGVIAFNIYQERKFRDKVRAQFGGAQEDALLKSSKNQIRDAEEELLRPVIIGEEDTRYQASVHAEEETDVFADEPFEQSYFAEKEEIEPLEPVLAQEETHTAQQFVFEDAPEETFPEPEQPQITEEENLAQGHWLLSLDGMSTIDLPWFDKRIDYLAFVSLASMQELATVPRLSNRRRYKVVGCTSNNRFQIAEAIPGVQYQAFVLGLQGIDRNGLVREEEIRQFKEHAASFAKQMNGGIKFTDIQQFLQNAAPIDALCEEVDKVIAIHLVSRSSILGTELRQAVERAGFELEHDGSFYYMDTMSNPLFTVVTLDGAPFTGPLLAKQAYRGFSMLFSVAQIRDGEKSFNRFMDIAVTLSSQLQLDLVDDKNQELSTQWLKQIRDYVIIEQRKMLQANIPPGEELAQRLFS